MSEIAIREATPDDAPALGTIVYEAFHGVATRHSFTPDFPTPEFATMLVGWMASSPGHYGVVAERDGEVLGSNFLDERDPIRGVGPITVNPAVQASGVGRRLMQAVVERGREAPGVRLLQDAFNATSMSLYASLGFDIKEPIVRIQGEPRSVPPAGIEVRPLTEDDVERAAAVCEGVHGFARTAELRDALALPMVTPIGTFRDGRLTGYATSVTNWALGHAAAETEEDLRALIAGGARLAGEPADFLLPSREGDLYRWCLAEGLRTVKPMSLMALGAYQEPRGAWFPSVIY